MFEEWRLKKGVPAYLQLKDYLKEMILEGVLTPGVKLPSTRELSRLAGVSRNTVILAYQYLEDDGLAETVRGRGTFVTKIATGRGAGVCVGRNSSPTAQCSPRNWTLKKRKPGGKKE